MGGSHKISLVSLRLIMECWRDELFLIALEMEDERSRLIKRLEIIIKDLVENAVCTEESS
jgi:hypothetical protein